MKLKIDRLARKEVTTKYGKRMRLSVLSGKDWYSSYEGDWNQHWRPGMEIEVDVRDNTVDGIVYHNIVTPKRDIPKSNGEVFDELKSLMTQMMKEILEIKAYVMPKGAPFDEEIPL